MKKKFVKTYEMFLSDTGELLDFNPELGDDVVYSTKEELNDYAKLLKKNGIDILFSEPSSYFYFTKDDKIAYAQQERMEGISLSSVHRPAKGFGTGYRLETTWTPTVEMAIQALNTVKPSWDRKTKGVPPKYNSLQDFLKSHPELRLY
jgi:hypothetical protein